MANHIEIIKEGINAQYRFRSNPFSPRPLHKNRDTHGATLKTELSQAMEAISANRRKIGIKTDNLLVLEMVSDAISPDVLDRMLNSFNLWLVEEVSLSEPNHSRLVVQFESKTAIEDFEHERELWEKDERIDKVLTYAQRRDLFLCIEQIRRLTREDRMGRQLKKFIASEQPFQTDMFLVDIDIWYNGDRRKIIEIEQQIRTALGTEGSKLLGDLFELPSLLLGRALVNEFSLNALLDLDLVALIDFPMGVFATEQCELYTSNIQPIIDDQLNENAPLATILDSGIFSGNPMLSSLIVGEEDFDNTENTTSDLNGHGTGVAGIVAYGDFLDHNQENHIFKPLVRICNGKVMHNYEGNTHYSKNKRPEQIIKEAIEYFYREYNCRIFNLSSGNADYIYNGGRQMPWAELLDQLIRELDIVIVISAGNVSTPNIPNFSTRDELREKCRDQLFNEEHRLIDPATSALGITVGSITRFSEPDVAKHGINRLSLGEKDYLSVFTRIGKGVGGAVKPDFVDYGGNYSLHQMPRGENRWYKNDRLLMEPSLNNSADKVFKGFNGTSFAAPRVTHIAARLERALETQLGERPSANLIKAILASSSRYPNNLLHWTETAIDPHFNKIQIPKQEQKLRLAGYGKIDDTIMFSGKSQVTLFAEDELNLRSLDLYKIPVPTEFLEIKSEKRIAIGFSYNPPTRLSRKPYIANSLWIEVFRRIEEDQLLAFISKKKAGAEEEAETLFRNFRSKYGAPFYPGSTVIQNSTLQQRVWEKTSHGGADLLWSDNEPYIYILVTGKERFNHPDIDIPQKYALAITFSYESEIDIELYQILKSRSRVKVRDRIRERTQIHH